MNIIRVRSINIIKVIEPHLTFNDSRHKLPYLENLLHTMQNDPESLLILATFNIDDNIRVFAIVSNPGVAYPYVQLQQMWSHPENGPNWYKAFLARAIVWAGGLGKEYIRAETQRNTEALYRRFGFEALSKNIKFDLTKLDFFNSLTKQPEELIQWANSTQK